MNLVTTGESISPACQNLVFLVRREATSYSDFKRTFRVIDAKRLSKERIGSLVKAQMLLDQCLEKFAFYQMKI